jgi:hypothetical protein
MENSAPSGDDLVSVLQIELSQEILDSHTAERQEFERWQASVLSRSAPADDGSSLEDPEPLTPARTLALIDAYLEEHEGVKADAKPAEPLPSGGELAFRIGPNRYLHVGEALKIVLIDGLGLFFAFATTSGIGALFYSWFFLSGADIVRRFMKCFEKITDPQERQVFESLYELQNRKAVEATGSEPDSSVAVNRARVSVSAEAIGKHLEGKISAEEIRAVLRGMAARDIVSEHDGLWSISFW